MELKKSSTSPPTQPTTSRFRKNPLSTSERVAVKPGAISETSAVSESMTSCSAKKWEKTTISTAERGISESIMLYATAPASNNPWLRRKKSRNTRVANCTALGRRIIIISLQSGAGKALEANRFVASRGVAGYAGPGFHNWPTGHILQDTDTKALIRPRSSAKKSFGAATGVSDPRLQQRSNPGH